MKKLRYLLLAVVALIAYSGIRTFYYNKKYTPNVSHELLMRLPKFDFMVDETFFLHEDIMLPIKLNKIMFQKGLVVPTPFGLVPSGKGGTLNVFISSGGGYIEILDRQMESLQEYKSNLNVKFTCYIAEASSAAFIFMNIMCDKKYILEGGKLMIHRVRNGGVCPSCFLRDKEFTELELTTIKKTFKEWYEMTRTDDDVLFSPEEAYKLGIVDGIIR